MRPARAPDLVGQRFGRLTVMGRAGTSRNRNALWRCACDCGGTATSSTKGLRAGNSQSCGCLQRERASEGSYTHGHSRRDGRASSTYGIWKQMLQRCANKNNPAWSSYGGRGIVVCRRWSRFENFLADMGERPVGKELDRRDNNRGYNKANCRWATRREQMRNTRATERAAVRQERAVALCQRGRTQREIAEALGVHQTTVSLLLIAAGHRKLDRQRSGRVR